MNLSQSNIRKVIVLLTVIVVVGLAGKYVLNVWTEYNDCYNYKSHRAYARFEEHAIYRAECASQTFEFPASY